MTVQTYIAAFAEFTEQMGRVIDEYADARTGGDAPRLAAAREAILRMPAAVNDLFASRPERADMTAVESAEFVELLKEGRRNLRYCADTMPLTRAC